MGCGASASTPTGGKVITKKSGKKYVEEAPPAEEAPPPREIGKTKETAWHRKNCTDADLSLAHTINEAYPFDDKERMAVEKKEKVWNPAGDGKHHNWGSVSVAKMQKKITCVACKSLILDRYEEAPFFYCIRCKTKGDRHLELCAGCYNAGVLSTGARKRTSLLGGKSETDSFGVKMIASEDRSRKVSALKQEDNLYQQNKNSAHLNVHHLQEPDAGRVPSKRSQASSRGDGRNPSPRPEEHRQISNPGRSHAGGGKPHSTVPCGNWKGKVTEGASGRAVIYKMFFDQSGDVSGTGPDNCEVRGSLTGEKIKWTEKHSWGTVQFTGDAVHHLTPVHIKGTFKASDGGGGKIDLSAG